MRGHYSPEPGDNEPRRGAYPRRPRDDSRDRYGSRDHYIDRYEGSRDWEWQGRTDRDRERDWDMDRDWSLRGRERDLARDPLDRDRPKPRPKSPATDSTVRRPVADTPGIPKGRKADTGRSAFARPEIPSSPRLPDQRKPNTPKPGPQPESPKIEAKMDRDHSAGHLEAVLRKLRELHDMEVETQAQAVAATRREALAQDFPDFPSLPELNARSQMATAPSAAARARAAANLAKKTKEVRDLCKNFLSVLLAQAQQDAGKNDVVRSLKAKQAELEAKLAQQPTARLERENAKLRKDVTELTGLVKTLSDKVETMASANSKLGVELGRLNARSIVQTSTAERVAAKVNNHNQILAGIEAQHLKSMVEFLTTGRQKMQGELDRQLAVVERLEVDMETIRLTPGAATTATAAVHATTASHAAPAVPAAPSAPAAQQLAQESAPTILFPGDDFQTLRNEIGSINQRLAEFDSTTKGLEARATQQTRLIAVTRIDVTKLTNAQKKMSETFDEMIETESRARAAESERLAGLEKTVHQLQASSSAAAPLAISDSAGMAQPYASGGDAAMADAAPAAFLSPVPEPIEPDSEFAASAATAATAETAAAAAPEAQAQRSDDEARLQSLEASLHALHASLQRTEEGVQTTKRDIDDQYAMLKMMVATLDTRFNNLTTKELFNAITGHIERLYPNTRQVQQDVEAMAKKVRALEALVQALPAGPKRPMAVRGLSSNGDSDTDPAAAKRRKTTNGAGPAEGNGASASTTAAPA